MVVSDNGTELTSNAMLKWQEDRKVGWHYIAPGKPMQNGLVEKFRALTATRFVPFFAFNFDRQFLAPKSTPFVQTVSPKKDQTTADIHRFFESTSTTSIF